MSQAKPYSSLKSTVSLSKLIKQELPSLNSFTIDEIPKLKKRIVFFLDSLDKEDRIFTSLQVPIKKKHLLMLETSSQIHESLFVFFLRFLKTQQIMKKYCIIALQIKDSITAKTLPEYSFIPGLENLSTSPQDFLNFKYLVYLIKTNKKWVVEICRLKDQKSFFLDFFNPETSQTQLNDLQSIIGKIHSSLYKSNFSEPIVFLQKPVVTDFNDFTAYISFLLYSLSLKEEELDYDEVKKMVESITETNVWHFINKMIWLVYSFIILNNNSSENFFSPSIIETETKSPSFNNMTIRTRKSQGKTKSGQYLISKEILKEMLKEMKKEIMKEIFEGKKDEKFINNENSSLGIKLKTLNKSNFKFSKKEFSELLLDYGENFNQAYSDKLSETRTKEIDYYRNYSKFNQLLWYYYYYDQSTYISLIDEYKKRFHNQLLNSLGLPPSPQKDYNINRPEAKEKELIKIRKSIVPRYNVSLGSELNPNFEKKINSINIPSNLNARRRSIMKKSVFPINEVNSNIIKTDPSPPSKERHSIKNEGTLKNLSRISFLNPTILNLNPKKSNNSISKPKIDINENSPAPSRINISHQPNLQGKRNSLDLKAGSKENLIKASQIYNDKSYKPSTYQMISEINDGEKKRKQRNTKLSNNYLFLQKNEKKNRSTSIQQNNKESLCSQDDFNEDNEYKLPKIIGKPFDKHSKNLSLKKFEI